MLREDDIRKRIQKLSEELGIEYERCLDAGTFDESILKHSRNLDKLIVEYIKRRKTSLILR